MSAWYPTLDPSTPRQTVEAIRQAFDQLYRLRERADAADRAGYLPRGEARTLYGPAALREALQSPGVSPLNVTGLTGVLSQPQKAYVPAVSALPDVIYDPMSQNGALVSYNGVVYWFDGATEPGRWRVLGAAAVFLSDTHANRLANYPASDYPIGTVFWETDRTALYENQGTYGASNWVWIMGTMYQTLANIPVDLGANDTGFLFVATDYLHTWRWGGATWAYAPADRASGEIAMFTAAPGTGWALCDGSTVTRTLTGATTASITLPDLTSAAANATYAKLGSPYTGTPVAASAPGLTGNTANESAHTHDYGGSVDVTPATTNIGAGAVNATSGHTHTYSGTTLAGSAHSHGAGTLAVDATGEPRKIVLLPYFRL